MTTDTTQSGLALQIQLAESLVVNEARAMRRGGVGLGRLFDAIDDVEKLYDLRAQQSRKQAIIDRPKTHRRVL
jgi:hypothetical protein